MTKKLSSLFIAIFLLFIFSGCSISDYLPWPAKEAAPVKNVYNPPKQEIAPAPKVASSTPIDCSKLNGGVLKGDGGENDMNLACCYQKSHDDNSCSPFQLVFNTVDFGEVTLNLSNDGQNCSERLDFGKADQIIDPQKKFYAGKSIVYTKELASSKKIGRELSCQDRLKSSYGDFKTFYGLPASLISKYWNGQFGFSGDLIQGLVSSCSGLASTTIKGDGSFADQKGRCCFLENLYVNNCQPFKAIYNTPDLGKVVLSLSKNKKNCVARVDYGNADQITDQSKKIYANKYVAQIYTPEDIAKYGGTKDKTGVLLCQQIFSVYAGTVKSDFSSIIDGYLKKKKGFSGNLVKSPVVEKSAASSNKEAIKARDEARVSYVKQIQQVLKVHYKNNGKYPPSLSGLSGGSGGKSYLPPAAQNPFPNDGSCQQDFNFSYQSLNEGSSYSLTFCLGSETENIPAGVNVATPENVIGAIEEENSGGDIFNNIPETEIGTSSEDIIPPENIINLTASTTSAIASSTPPANNGNSSTSTVSGGSGTSAPATPGYVRSTLDINDSSEIKIIQGSGGY